MMKMKARLLVVSAALVLIGGCGGCSSSVEAGDPGSDTKEAAAKATEYWHSHVGHCGESYYIALGGSGGGLVSMPRMVVELKDVRFSMRADPVSEAEKLNGLSWRGSSHLVAKVYRTINLPVQSPQWGQWVEGGQSILELLKTNGQWSIKPVSTIWGFPAYELAPDCGWIARIGQGRAPTGTIASYQFIDRAPPMLEAFHQESVSERDVTLTDVNVTMEFTYKSAERQCPSCPWVPEVRHDTNVWWFWQDLELTIQKSNKFETVADGSLKQPHATIDCFELYLNHTKLACPIDRSAAEKLRQEILDAQAEWRKKYPH